jgi:hypothetical protein
VRVFLARPGCRPAELGGLASHPEPGPAWDPPLPRRIAVWVGLHFGLVLVATTLFLLELEELSSGSRMMAVVAIVASLASLGALLEQRPWGTWLEASRVSVLGVGLALLVWAPAGPALAGATLLAGLAVAGWWLARLAPHPRAASRP